MKKMMLLVDDGPEFNEQRYILKSGEYEGYTTREQMMKATQNFFDCPETPPVEIQRCAGCYHPCTVTIDGESLCCRAPVYRER